MSAEPELARFDTHRAVQTEESSEQTDFRAVGAREQGQLALDEIEHGVTYPQNRVDSTDRVATSKPTRTDLEAALECARATIDGLREQVAQLEAERDRLRRGTETEAD